MCVCVFLFFLLNRNSVETQAAPKHTGSGLVWRIVVTPIPRNVKEAFEAAAVVSCHSDDRTITHSADHSEGWSPNRESGRRNLLSQTETTSQQQKETQGFGF